MLRRRAKMSPQDAVTSLAETTIESRLAEAGSLYSGMLSSFWQAKR